MELSATHRMVLYKYLVLNNKAKLPLDIPSQLRYGSMVLNTTERRPRVPTQKTLIYIPYIYIYIYIYNKHANNINYSMTHSPSLTYSFHLSFWCLLICMNTISKVSSEICETRTHVMCATTCTLRCKISMSNQAYNVTLLASNVPVMAITVTWSVIHTFVLKSVSNTIWCVKSIIFAHQLKDYSIQSEHNK